MTADDAGTDLYRRTIEFDYGDPERTALMRKVWSVTPFMVEAFTGPISNFDRYGDMRRWCREQFSDEAWPIHGHPGRWQFGGATILGWTFIGFATAEQLAAFLNAFPDVTTPAPSGETT